MDSSPDRRSDIDDLITRTQLLPQELIDMIEVEVFAAAPKHERTIKSKRYSAQHYDLQLPDTLALLQVSRSTRPLFQASYFSSNFICSGVAQVVWWAEQFSANHQRLVKAVKVVCGETVDYVDELWWHFCASGDTVRNFGGRVVFVERGR